MEMAHLMKTILKILLVAFSAAISLSPTSAGTFAEAISPGTIAGLSSEKICGPYASLAASPPREFYQAMSRSMT